MRKQYTIWKRFLAIVLAIVMMAGMLPEASIQNVFAAESYTLDNGYIKAEVSEKNGGFYIGTVAGDKINKDDNNKHLLFHNGTDDTSFTSFQVTRGNVTKEYIFGGKYEGSSEVVVKKANEEITAVWSVDNLEFTQTMSLVNSGATEHGTVHISYSVKNSGESASVKARILFDTALGYQDYAYYNVGAEELEIVEHETKLGADGYEMSFYAVDNPYNPSITAYTLNASINHQECKPYQTTFAHWNSLASTVFDYNVDTGLTFTNPNNKKYLTADSAYALYYDMGKLAQGKTAEIATNYGIFSNETVSTEATAAVNVIAPDALTLEKNKQSYTNKGEFEVKTQIENFSNKTYERVRVVVYTTGGIEPLKPDGTATGATYNKPYTVDYENFTPEQIQSTTWKFKASPQKEGSYAKIQYKVYDVSDDSSLSTDLLKVDKLIGEGRCYILCPGSVSGIPEVQFTSSSPKILYTEGTRNFYVTGTNFSMLTNKGEYSLMLSRTDGQPIDGKDSIAIPSSQLSIDESKNTMTIMLTDDAPGKLPEGQYKFTFDYTEAGKTDLSAPALTFTVKDDVSYKNDAYGVLAVVKQTSMAVMDLEYTVKAYLNEKDYEEALAKKELSRNNVLLEFRGSFSKKEQDDGSVVYTGISLNADDNVMTLNNTLDFEEGTVTITEINEHIGTRGYAKSVKVDFDCKIYTSGDRDFVFEGVAALTELEQGADFGLIPYDRFGQRKEMGADVNTIVLLWPGVGQAYQEVLGLDMRFQYGELGIIEHKEEGAEDTRVVAFGAFMNLSFLVPSFMETGYSDRNALEIAHGRLYDKGDYSADDLRELNKDIPYNRFTENTDATEIRYQDNTLEYLERDILIDDVLYGGGQHLGVRLAVALTLPAFVISSPLLNVVLKINTVGDWSFDVKGKADFVIVKLDAEIEIMSDDNIPIPNVLSFTLYTRMLSGINLDGVGVLWLRGAGGEINDIYNTVFLKDSIPPVQLILRAQLSLFCIITAKGEINASLRGMGISLWDGTVTVMPMTSLPILPNAGIQMDWYPEFYFMAHVNVRLAGIGLAVNGSGYLTAEESGFYEFFIRAAVSIPTIVPIIGGMTLAGVNMGANDEKIWGQLEALNMKFGVVYYWTSGEVSWDDGAEVMPTYPELVSMASKTSKGFMPDVPVYYDAENNRTLYMRAGTNLVQNTSTIVSSAPVAAGVITQNALTTTVDGNVYTLSLANNNTKDEMLVMEWNAESLEEARADVANISITEAGTSNVYPIKLLTSGVDVNDPVNKDTNANLTYDKTTKKASLLVTFTKQEVFGKHWKIQWKENTKNFDSMVLYDVNPMPELSKATTFEVKDKDNKATVVLAGELLDKYNNVNIFAAPTDGGEAVLLYHKENPNGFAEDKTLTFDLPETLSSGEYNIQILAHDDGCKYQGGVDKPYTHVNANQPNGISKISAENGGDYTLDVSVNVPENTEFDGYSVTAYKEDGTVVSAVSNLMYMADGSSVQYAESGKIVTNDLKKPASAEFSVGGQYLYDTDDSAEKEVLAAAGFEAGKEYKIGVRTWKQLDSGKIVYSVETQSDLIEVTAPVETTFSISANADAVTIEETRGTTTFSIPVYNKNKLELTLHASNAVTGTWELDKGGKAGKVTEATKDIVLPFEDLAEGTHRLDFKGKNAHGDSVGYTYVFGVDTQGPKLLIESPLNGSLFAYNADGTKLTITGVTDPETKFYVVNETTGVAMHLYDDSNQPNPDSDGRFTFTTDRAGISSKYLVQTIKIVAKDNVGNETVKYVTLTNDGLGKLEELQIWAKEVGTETDITNTNVKLEGKSRSYTLTLKAKLSDGSLITINDNSLIDWSVLAAEGTASLVENNGEVVLTVSSDAQASLTARLLVSDLGANAVMASFGDGAQRSQPIKKTATQLNDGELKVDGTLTYGDVLSKLTIDQTEATFTAVDGTTKVEGTVEWLIPETIPEAGTETEPTKVAWIFKPTDSVHYAESTGTIAITVNKATPIIDKIPTAETPTITYNPSNKLQNIGIKEDGNVIWTVGGTQTGVTGIWSWKQNAVVPTVDKQKYTAVFTPTDTKNYNTTETDITITVNKATPVITENPVGSAVTYGQTIADSTLTGGSVQYSDSDATTVAGTFTWDAAEISKKPEVSDSETTKYNVVFTPTDTINYETVAGTAMLKVNPKTVTLNWLETADRYYKDGKEVAAEVSNKVSSTDEVLVVVKDGDKVDAGTYTAEAVELTGADAENYILSTDPEDVTKDYTIAQSSSELIASVYNKETPAQTFVYGDTITVKGNVSLVDAPAPGVLSRIFRAIGGFFGGAKDDQVALFVGEKQITDYVDVNADGTYEIKFDTSSKKLAIGDDQEVTVKYTGNKNCEGTSKNVIISLKQAEVTANLTGSAEKEYDGTTKVPEQHSLSMKVNGVLEGDKVSASAEYEYLSEKVGTAKVEASDIVLAGEDAEWYVLTNATDVQEVGTITASEEPDEGGDKEPDEGGDKEPDDGGNKEPDEGGDKEPDDGGNKEPDEGGDKEPDDGGNKEPDEGGNKEPDEGGNKEPDEGGNKEPDEGGNKEPDDGGNKEPDEGGNKEPDDGGDKEPDEGGNKEPDEGGDKEPDDGGDKEPDEGGNKEPDEGGNKEPDEGGNKEPDDGGNKEPDDENKDDVADTGDDSPIVMWGIMAVISLAALVGFVLTYLKTKTKKSRN